MAKKKKKKRSAAELHRNVKDSLLALPYAIEEQKRQGKQIRAFLLRYLTGPVLRVMNKTLDATRYRGKEGEKTKQTEQMRRHLEHRKAAIKHIQGQLQQQQKRRRPL
ncbi:MAG TPA: hypothetical protein VF167_09740 [Longimicrobiaceae bacterium]